MRSVWVTLGSCVLLAGIACRDAELDFTLPDGGTPGGAPGQRRLDGAADDDGQDASAASFEMPADGAARAMLDEPLADASLAGRSGSSDGAGDARAQSASSDLIVYDPAGRAAGPDDAASWCALGHVEVELCGNDLDEDCDGRVDEMARLGGECEAGCKVGELQCDSESHELVCKGLQGCDVEQVVWCGNGFLDADEQCDPQAPGESLDSCTWRCTRPLFTRCLFGVGNTDPSVCEGNTECSWFTGACMPVLGVEGLRCPEYRVVGSEDESEIYPMLETEADQCWVSCSRDEQCPPSLGKCYQGYCVVTL